MTTLVLQAAGSAIGSFFGGPIGAIAGRALGAIAGSAIDGALLGGGGRTIQGPRLGDMEGLTAAEGAAIPRVYGRARVGGHLIWATRFEEVTSTATRSSGGGKGGLAPRQKERTFSYFANVAIALCDGPITFVRRIWADGREIDQSRLTMRIYRGDDAQMPDALIIAKEGAGNAPAYRGTAYVVFERFALAEYGNRVPQFSFEVVRALPGLREQVRAVNLIPGSSEFAYQTVAVSRMLGPGASQAENRNQLQATSDVVASLDQLQALCPQLTGVSIITSWFGDSLDVATCSVAPRVDNAIKLTEGGTWSVAGLDRTSARLVSLVDGVPAYGGTPSDAALLSLIAEIKRRGLKVTLYPFMMMDIARGNTLPNPYGGTSQPAFPWRGRITCRPAPGQPGSPDGTALVVPGIAAFVGTVTPSDLSLDSGAVTCAKPDEWSFRRHILHHARLAEAAGGVDGFVIGSEMIGLTRVRSASGVYPFVAALQGIAADARAMLGPQTRITYAADWTEYGAHVLGGGQEVRFPLDPLWAHPAISAVGIDWYPPISDWRDGIDHLDAEIARSGTDPDYLTLRQTSGEAFDWYYAGDAARNAQLRAPITDGAAGKPWIYRAKDMASWWRNPHIERVGGIELATSTAWLPGTKPIWLTETGCPAVDKGANSPNVFPDPKSSENGLPPFSSGQRDDLMLLRALEAQVGVFDPSSPRFSALANPLNAGGTLRMLAPDDMALWAWDARPFPAFPMLETVWSDGANWQKGHWLNGRLESAPLDRLIAAILGDHDLPEAGQLGIDDIVDGYVIDRPMSAREAIEPLIRLFGLDARFSGGQLLVNGRAIRQPVTIGPDELVLDRDNRPFSLRRAQESELPRELRIGFIDGAWEYRRAASRSRRLGGSARREVALDGAIVSHRAQVDDLADQRLKEAWISREAVKFSVSPRQIALEPGDAVHLDIDGTTRLFRIGEIDDGEVRRVTAVSAERSLESSVHAARDLARLPAVQAIAARPFAVPVELPLACAGEQPLMHLATFARPWPGTLDLLRSTDGDSFSSAGAADRPALIGTLLTPLPPGPVWRWNRSPGIEIRIEGGMLQSISDASALAGLNSFAVQGPDGLWEVLTAASAELIGPQSYRLSRLVRGIGGSESAALRAAPVGSRIVGVDEALVPLTSDLADLGRSIRYRVVPPGVDAADPAVLSLLASSAGLALKPLSPVHIKARRTPSGIEISWIRRTRIGGDNWELAEPPLSEASEAYLLTIHAGGIPVRTVRLQVPMFSYSGAGEIADFGSMQTLLDVAVAQISDVVGAGAVRRGLIPVR